MSVIANVMGRRITGGAVVTIIRSDGRKRRYRVGLRRYNRLRDVLAAHLGTCGGDFRRSGFEVDLREVRGFSDARKWFARFHGAHKPRHWMAAA
ncbi:MAG: hypothetical protein LBJ59_11980 [Zoogloeaceae bacterium]|jgi:hypothetical protein|nr:hypothetical protein [Zoogloeaceae bacterium]